MKGILFYYSANGNTELTCRHLANRLHNMEITLWDITAGTAPDLGDYALTGFACFTDYMDLPELMQRFIVQLPRQTEKPAFCLSTCAVSTGHTLKTMDNLLTRKGFSIFDSFTLRTPEAYPPLRAKGIRRDGAPGDRALGRFHDFIRGLDTLAAEMQDGWTPVASPVKRTPFDLIMPRYPRTKARDAMGKKIVDTSRCTGCGTCLEVCAYGAISFTDRPVFDEKSCRGCFACYNHCPAHAIHTAQIKDTEHYPAPTCRQALAD